MTTLFTRRFDVNVRLILWLALSCFLWFSPKVMAGDNICYGYESITKHFACTSVGNCVWWTAYKRPDLAANITGTGWNGGQWYDKFKALGFPVGLEPRAGAVVEFSKPGHVAYIEKVNSDGSFGVSEMDSTGKLGSGGVYHVTYSPNSDGTYRRNDTGRWTLKGFIYHKESCDPSKERCGIKSNGPIGWYPPVDDCTKASQWFRLVHDTKNQVSRVEPATKSDCPQVCYAN